MTLQRAKVKLKKEKPTFSLGVGANAGQGSVKIVTMEYEESILMKRIDDLKLPETLGKQLMTLHCAQCNAVLGDSIGVCGEIQCMDSIICSRVTNNVVVSDGVELGHEGELVTCIYSSVKCQECHSAVGKVIHSAPTRLAMIRSLFLLRKANISCYILNSSSIVKASTLTFDLKPLSDGMDELRQQIEERLHQMSHIKSRLANGSVTSELEK